MPAERLQKLLAARRRRLAPGRGGAHRRGPGHRQRRRAPAWAIAPTSADDRVALDGAPIGGAETTVHFAVHKPRGLLELGAGRARARPRDRARAIERVRRPPLAGGPAGRRLRGADGPHERRRVGEPRPPPALRDRARVRGPAGRAAEPRARSRPCSAASSSTRAGAPAAARSSRAAPPEVAREPPESAARGCGCGSARVASARCGASSPPSATACCGSCGPRLGPLALRGLRAGEWRALRRGRGRGPGRPRPTGRARHARVTPLAVAIDGPSGSGKSTIGYAVAQRIGATFVDTGLMYRALTLAALERGVDLDDGERARPPGRRCGSRSAGRAPSRRIGCETVLLDRRDVTERGAHAARRPRASARSAATPRCATRCCASSALRRDAATR